MSYFRNAAYAILGVFILLIALNNQQQVEFVLIPEFIPGLSRWALNVPLFIVTLGALLIGIVVGYVLEYIREAQIRMNASRTHKALKKTSSELDALKKETGKHDDDVLALIK